tara:strand:- start:107 stop:1033 length:927 start_codon:yes stop_codon:yes gene_type:complete
MDNTPKVKIKGNTIRKRPQYQGHLPDSRWMLYAQYRPIYETAKIRKDYNNLLANETAKNHPILFPQIASMGIGSFTGKILHLLIEDFVKQGGPQMGNTASMTRLVNGISLSYEQVAENLAQMADFAEANPNVMSVRETYRNRRSIYEYYADLPPHPALHDGYNANYTNYQALRHWLSYLGGGDFNNGITLVRAMPTLIVEQAKRLKTMIKNREVVEPSMIRDAMIEHTITLVVGSMATVHDAQIPSNFHNLCLQVLRGVSYRNRWFTFNELESTYTLTDAQKDLLRDAMKDSISQVEKKIMLMEKSLT